MSFDSINLPTFRPALGIRGGTVDPLGSTAGFPHFWYDTASGSLKLVSASGASVDMGAGVVGSGMPSLNRGAIPSSRIAFTANPTNNDTLTLGGAVIKFVTALGAVVAQTQVKIGGSAAATQALVVKAVNGIADAANITDGSTPLTAANVGAAIVADAVSTSVRVRLADARGGTAIAGTSASVVLSDAITGGGEWDHANLNETGQAESAVSECRGKVTITTAMATAMAAGGVFIELPFTPTTFSVGLFTSAGAQLLTITDTFTISGNALVLTQAGAVHLANTNIVYFAAAS